MKTYEDIVSETLTPGGRRKLARKAKQQKAKLKLGRKRAAKKTATGDTILKRAQKRARARVADHITRSKGKGGLSFAGKARVEKQVDSRKGMVKQHLRREIQKARKDDRKRK